MTLQLDSVCRIVGGETHIYPTDITFEPGKLNVLLGPTLAGKTSLMRLMAGLDIPTSGQILWKNRDVTGLPVRRRNVAMVYQQFINYPTMSVYENIASPLRLQGLDNRVIDRRVRAVADLLQLEALLKRRPEALSGGQQQRCALARALVKEADLVLLDEPLANLDYKLREELRAEIPGFVADNESVFIYATTEPTEALMLGGHTAVLWEGAIRQFGPAVEVYRKPSDTTTARVLSDPPMNFLAIDKKDDRLIFGKDTEVRVIGESASLPDAPYIAGIRPNHLCLSRPVGVAISFRARVAVTEITGSESIIHLRNTDNAHWVALEHGAHSLKPDAAIEVHVEPEHVYLFSASGKAINAAVSLRSV